MNEIDVLKSTYNDSMSVFRNEYEKDDVGMSTKDLVEKMSNIPCEMDRVNTSVDKFVGDLFSLNTQYMIYTLPDLDVVVGDLVKVIHRGKVYELEIGQPYFYSSHTEIPAKLKERV